MANRRMFSHDVTESDAFFELSKDARLLWFYLGMSADDDGFLNSVRHVIACSGVKDDALNELIDTGFIHRFESGVYVLMHWKVNNYIQKDRYTPTLYQEEFNQLVINDRMPYQLKTECIQDVSEMYTQDSKDKDSKDKDSKDRDRLVKIEGSLEGERETLKTPVFTAVCPQCQSTCNVNEIEETLVLGCKVCHRFFVVDEEGNPIKEVLRKSELKE